MKNKKIIISVIITALILASVTLSAVAKNTGFWFQQEKTDAYVFPKNNGKKTMSWNDLVKLHQIPEEKLKTMTTKGLLDSCLDYPLFAGGMAFSNESMYAGFQKTKSEFNGLTELFSRKDSGSAAIKLYQEADLSKVSKEDKYPALRMKYLELIISQYEILDNLTDEEKRVLMKSCILKLEAQDKDESGLFFSDSTLLILARLLDSNDSDFAKLADQYSGLRSFIDNGVLEQMSEEEIKSLREYIFGKKGDFLK